MQRIFIALFFSLLLFLWACAAPLSTPATTIQWVGNIENPLVEECSGLEASPTQPDLLWAINDGGHGPYLYAMATNGRHRGRYRVEGAQNRDWEGLDAFVWKNRSYLLIADFGDNKEIHPTHRLYILPEPQVRSEKASNKGRIMVSRQIIYQYPQQDGHDAEGVAVDLQQQKILLLTKRDNPPLVYELPLFPKDEQQIQTAKLVGPIERLPPPTRQDRKHRFGAFRSQPTAMDISADNSTLVVLTYKDAYLFQRRASDTWAAALAKPPQKITLPLPEKTPMLIQREAITFKDDSKPYTLVVTSEGIGAAIYQVKAPN